jgi:hypothetical protein
MRNFSHHATLLLATLLILPISSAAAQSQDDTAAVKAAAKTFYSAVQRGDAGAIAQMLVVQNDPQQLLAQAYANFILAGKTLGETAKTRFPNSTNPLAVSTLPPEDAAKLDSASVTLNNDTATLKTTGASSPLMLQKTNGAWRVLVNQQDANPEHRAQQLALIRAMTDALKEATAELNADQYATVAELENAVKQKLGTVLAKAMQADLPTSRPSTKP